MTRTWLICTAALAVFLAGTQASGAVTEHTWTLRGRIERMDPGLASTFGVGQELTGTFTFEKDPADVDGYYDQIVTSLEIGTNSYAAELEPGKKGNIYVADQLGGGTDRWLLGALLDGPEIDLGNGDELTLQSVNVAVLDYDGAVFANVELPEAPPRADQFENRQIAIRFDESGAPRQQVLVADLLSWQAVGQANPDVTLPAVGGGYYIGRGPDGSGVDAGQSGNTGQIHAGQINDYYLRGYLTFDVAGIANPQEIGEVWLRLNLDTVTGGNSLVIAGVAHDQTEVDQPHSAGSREGLAVFEDLGSGPVLGVRRLAASDEGTDIAIALDRDALVAEIERAKQCGSSVLLLGLSETDETVMGRRVRSSDPMSLRELVIKYF